MRKSRRGSPKHQVNNIMIPMLAFVESKHQAKIYNDGKPPTGKIFSNSTAGTYLNCNIRFFLWCREHYGCREFSECRPYIEEFLYVSYIKIGRSAWTIWKNASAICKFFMISTNDLNIELPASRREDIRKNRYLYEAFDEEKWDDLVQFCLATGLRLCELKRLKVDDVYWASSGNVIVHVRCGKGGRFRHVVALNDFPLTVKKAAKNNGQVYIFEKLPHNANIHYYRREFAQTLYKREARTIDTLPSNERYYCKADMRGVVLDRRAMLTVSRALGHNRFGVTTTYLQGIDLNK